MWGLAPANGVFREVRGNGTIFPDGSAIGILGVAAASIDTNNPQRDVHLRSADFFDTQYHPDLTFMADGIRASVQGVAVTGELTVRGRTRPFSFDANACVFDGPEICIDAKVRIDRADFCLTWNQLGMASMRSTLTIHAVFTQGERQ